MTMMMIHFIGPPYGLHVLPIKGANMIRLAPLAQLAEQQTLNLRVRGSSPWRRTPLTSAFVL